MALFKSEAMRFMNGLQLGSDPKKTLAIHLVAGGRSYHWGHWGWEDDLTEEHHHINESWMQTRAIMTSATVQLVMTGLVHRMKPGFVMLCITVKDIWKKPPGDCVIQGYYRGSLENRNRNSRNLPCITSTSSIALPCPSCPSPSGAQPKWCRPQGQPVEFEGHGRNLGISTPGFGGHGSTSLGFWRSAFLEELRGCEVYWSSMI